MRAPRLLVTGVVLLAAAVGACSGVSHLHLLQPPAPPAQASAVSPVPLRFLPAPIVQLGIDVDFYAWPGMDTAAIAAAEVGYIKSLHANAVSVSFPFFMNGKGSSAVHANPATPSPAELATVALAAERAGLFVTIRPLLDERSLGVTRVSWKPLDMTAWFASYQQFLLPYARMAQATHIPQLAVGVELTRFASSPLWASLAAALRTVYHGRLMYSANTHGSPRHITPAARVRQMVDAYPRLGRLRPSASQRQVNAAWDGYARTLPPGVVLSEVGIASQPGAYAAPYTWGWPGEPIDPVIQPRWFTAACHAVTAERLGGLYFWSLGWGQRLDTPPSVKHPASFVAGPGARAISTCFARLGMGAE